MRNRFHAHRDPEHDDDDDDAHSPSEVLEVSGGARRRGLVWIVDTFNTLFLPEGYPNTVTEDYLTHQKYNTFQALCSSITGTLSTRSILRGVGVGKATATALSGTVQWIIRDGVGMVGRIAVASHIASRLDNDAKRWRFVADVTGDVAVMLDVFSSYLPAKYWLFCICVAALFRAVTAVAGGATRVSLTHHFAKCDNTADVSAKEGSQETAVNLIGMFLGMFVAWAVPETFTATAVVFLIFTSLHLWANYWGARSLVLRHLNEARADVCLQHFTSADVTCNTNRPVPTPEGMRDLEPVVGHTRQVNPAAKVNIGSSFRDMKALVNQRDGGNGRVATRLAKSDLRHHHFAIFCFPRKRKITKAGAVQCDVHVVLAAGIKPVDVLKGWVAANMLCPIPPQHEDASRSFVVDITPAFSAKFHDFARSLVDAGWRVDRMQLGLSDWRVKNED